MFTQKFIQSFIDALVVFATDLLIPAMSFLFISGIVLRILIFYTVKREEWFSIEFEKRIDIYLKEQSDLSNLSFFVVSKKLLEKTFYELFVARAYLKRRRPDMIMAMSDRIFLIKQGVAWFVHDILKQIKFVRWSEQAQPKLFEISKKTFARNPCFTKVFGVVPASVSTDLLNILPGVFIVLGIFGTFLGIMKALPDLSEMDLNDIAGTKLIMDQFLLKISFAMSSSLLGIVMSVTMSFLNSFWSPHKIFVTTVDRMESSLDILWNISSHNHLPEEIGDFDENRDPIEALAQQAIDREIAPKGMVRPKAEPPPKVAA